MKVVGSTCAALKGKVAGGDDVVRCLSDQSLAISGKMSSSKMPLLDQQMSVFLQDMNSCYSKLKELVPTLPTHKKATKVEILQHVIDYIWDLQVELDDEPETRVVVSPMPMAARTPLTALNAELASISVEVNTYTFLFVCGGAFGVICFEAVRNSRA